MVAGHLTQKKGKYVCVIDYTDADGNRKQKWKNTGLSISGNKKKAEEILYEMRYNFVPPKPAKEENALSDSMPLTDFLETWLNVVKTTVAPTTYDSYESIVKKKIIPYFQSMNLGIGDLQARQIQQFYLHEQKTVSGTTVNHEHAVLHKALKYAFRMDLIPNNPADKVDPPKKNKFHGDPLTDVEAKQLIEQTQDNKLGLLILVTLCYGLRRSEVFGLRWKAVDFDNNQLHINHTVVEIKQDGKKCMVGRDTTKTKSSCRTLPLIPEVRDRLMALQRVQLENRRLCGNSYCTDWDGYIFVNEMGELLKLNYIESAFPKLLKKLGIRKVRFHDLRHTCASLMNHKKVSLMDTRDYLGHSDIGTTANIYVHMDWSDKANSARAMEEAIDIPDFQGYKNPWEK